MTPEEYIENVTMEKLVKDHKLVLQVEAFEAIKIARQELLKEIIGEIENESNMLEGLAIYYQDRSEYEVSRHFRAQAFGISKVLRKLTTKLQEDGK
jgi:hypothetical protein